MTQNPIHKQKQEIRDKEIVKLYPQLTMQELADKFGISKGRIKQIIDKNKIK